MMQYNSRSCRTMKNYDLCRCSRRRSSEFCVARAFWTHISVRAHVMLNGAGLGVVAWRWHIHCSKELLHRRCALLFVNLLVLRMMLSLVFRNKRDAGIFFGRFNSCLAPGVKILESCGSYGDRLCRQCDTQMFILTRLFGKREKD